MHGQSVVVPVSEKARLAASPDFDHRFAENLFCATRAYEHLHEFPCFVSAFHEFAGRVPDESNNMLAGF
jgi:hypothetical protein